MTWLALLSIIVLGIILALLLTWLGRTILFAVPMLHGPVFVPTDDKKLKLMIKLAKINPGEKIVDIGSGDGKIVLALAKKGFRAEGVEINPVLVWRSKQMAKKLGLEELAQFTRKSFWDIDFAEYDVIFFYGTTYVMQRLEQKLQTELKPGARVVSNHFQFPTWQPEAEQQDVRLYVK